MLSTKLSQYLDKQHIPYTVISHRPTFTASQTAQAAHIPGEHFAKVVVMKLDSKMALIVLPANYHIDFKELKESTHANDIEIAREYEFNQQFPDCEVGAMPPFGELYGLDVFLASSLAKQDWIACNGGTHADILKFKGADFLKLLHPKLLANC